MPPLPPPLVLLPTPPAPPAPERALLPVKGLALRLTLMPPPVIEIPPPQLDRPVPPAPPLPPKPKDTVRPPSPPLPPGPARATLPVNELLEALRLPAVTAMPPPRADEPAPPE